MRILANTTQLQDKAAYAAALSSQLSRNVKELNDIYYNLDSEIKSRQGIGSSIHSLQQRIEKAQQKMYNISSFLGETARQYNVAESSIAARGASIGTIVSANANAFDGIGGSSGAATSAIGQDKRYRKKLESLFYDEDTAISVTDQPAMDINGNSILDTLQTVLDIAGFIPGLGDAMDGINVVISLLRGNPLDAALSAIGLVPVVGSALAVPLKTLLKAAGNADEMASAVKMLAKIFGGLDNIVDGLKAVMNTVVDMLKALPDKMAHLADNKLLQKALGGNGSEALMAMVAGLQKQVDEVVSKVDEITETVKKAVKPDEVGKGPYSHLEDPKNVGPGKDFTPSQKKQIIDENIKKNDGVVKSDLSGEELVKPSKSQKGITPPDNEWQIDHIDPKDKGGSNSYSNAQVLSRKENRAKSNK